MSSQPPDPKNLIKLSELEIGKKAIIKTINTLNKELKNRLKSLGMLQGATITYLKKSPLGDPKIFSCLNSTISIRNELATQIYVIRK